MSPPSALRVRQLTWVVEVGDVPPYRTGPYEKHLNHSKYEREDVQKKTFAKWINSQLAKQGKPLVNDLFQDLRDGEVLLSLLEILTAQQFKRERGRMRVHHLNNVNAALRALAAAGVRLVNISSGDIVDGNPKLILGLVWSIILHWQVHYHLKELMSELQQTNLEKTLLAWCRNHTQDYAGVKVENFTSSWSDGLAFSALLHRFRPELFRYNDALGLSPSERLDRVFTLAQDHLGIDRLLDPEDVNTTNPDKKSIMMYVMCLFQSLPQTPASHESCDLEHGDGDEIGSPGDLGAEVGGGSCSASRPVSVATTCSVELGAYGAALEDALAALLLGEERLRDAPPPDEPEDVGSEQPPGRYLVTLKEYFHEHEKFLLELSEQQWRVGGVLEEGARLLREAALARDEAAEVRLQLRLLARRWEALRGAAMTRQADLHRALMRTQHDHLQRFRRWLTATEDRMSRMEAVSAPAGAALEATRALHADLRQQQPLVDALADCVLVVDDEDDRHEHQDGSDRPDLPLTSSDNVAAMEDELRALGERWSHACQWTLSRLQRLQRYVDLEHRADLLRDKVSTLENDLKQMEAYPAQEIGEVLERIRSLQRCGAELRVRRDELNELLRSLEEQDDDHTASQLADRADQCQDRLDALDLILRVQADRIRELGFDVDVSSELGGEVGGAGGTDEHVSKKPRLEAERAGVDFQAGYRAFNNWAAETENALLMCMEQLQTASGTEKATGEARTLLQRVTRESEERRADFSNVEEIQRRLAADQELAEEAKLHAQSIEEVKKRWEGIQKMLLDIRNTLNLLEDKDNVYKNIKAFESDLQDIHAWKDRMLKETATNNQLIHLRNKIRTLKQLEIKLKELNAQSIILLTKAFSKTHKDEVEADTKRINEAFEELFLHLCKKEVEIKIALNKKLSPIQTEDEYKAVQRKIQEMESQIISEHAIISTREEMAKKLEELKNMRRQFDDLQASYDAVVKEKRDKFEKGSLEELNLRSSVENLVLRFDDSKTILEQKIDKLEKGISLLERLEGEQNAVDSWLKGLHRFMDEHRDVPVGELQLLEELLDRSNKFLEEKSEYTARVEAIEEMKRTVLEDCEEVVAKTLKADTLRKRFDSLTEESLKTNEELRRALEKTEGLFRRVDDLETWLGRLRDDMPREDECGIEDSAQLYQMKMRFQTLKERCDDKTDEFRNLNEDGNEMLLNAGAPAVARRLTQLNARWTADTHAVYERYKVLAEAWLEAGELRAWLSAQAAWLDGLQRRLRPDTSRAARADAEDISDELYDLENYIANRDEARVSRIEAVARQLADAHIMPQWIRNETETLARRWDELRLQAAERSAELEAAAREAARCEVALDSLRQWLGTVRDGGHVPTSAEFADRRASLREVRTQEEAHRAAGRREAADRLRDQLELAERELVSLERRVSVSGAGPAAAAGRLPGDLAARLRRATETLEDVQRASGGLALHTHDPDEVRTQLRACLRFYRTLSEIKSEVESIIKTGRKTVEEGGAERQRALSAEIDALKELYNRLGAHVTEAKGRLEAALLAAREIQSDLASLGVWLRSAKVAGRHKLELEMSRMAAIRDKLQANYEELARGCDPAHLAGLRAQLDDVNEQWERLRRRADTGADPAEDRGEDPARGEDSTKVDQSSVDEISAIEEEKGEGVEQELEYEEDGDDEAAAARLEAAGEKMLRRLQVVLLTLAAVPAERDPAKRLEILKNQVGGVAPDAAALISRGDSLVYRLHGTRPALARRLQEVVQDPLRARWSALRAEAEHRRREALRAEDDLRELGARLEAVRRAGGGSAAAHDANRLRDLCRDLRDRRIAFPERAVADALAEYDAAREQRRGSDDHRHNLEERSEVVTRCNLEREAVSRALGSLRGSPLGGGDYDDFPLQEDALNEIKSAIDDIERSLAEVEGRGVGGEQAARVTDKLRNELTRLKEDYRERCDRWQRCAGTWARLYGALEEGGRQLDDLLAALDTVEEEGGACDHHRLAIWQEQLEECTRGADELKSLGGAVTAACGGALGEKVRGQIQEHERRRALAEERVRTLRTTSPTSVKERSRARRPETCATLARVRELLLTTSAHPADRASLAVRHSLVKAREEEVARALTTARGDERLELEQARASLSAHGQYVSHKLASLRKYSIRLDDALAWTQTIRDRITRGDLSGLREAVRDKEVEIGEVLENYNNIERECHAAKHSVCQEIRDRVQRLREDWREIRQDEAGGEIGE
nr:dystrophin, isoforms A/C/F/G/H-like isoform X6 [Danaus plexippus plexippus]